MYVVTCTRRRTCRTQFLPLDTIIYYFCYCGNFLFLLVSVLTSGTTLLHFRYCNNSNKKNQTNKRNSTNNNFLCN